MRDNLLHLSDANVAADAFAASALPMKKTPADGVWLEFTITRNTADATATLDITVYAKDADSGWALTDDPVGIVPQIANADVANGATINRFIRVQTKHLYAKPYYNVAGATPDYTIECDVVSGPQRDSTV